MPHVSGTSHRELPSVASTATAIQRVEKRSNFLERAKAKQYASKGDLFNKPVRKMAPDYKTVSTEPQEWEQNSNPDKSFSNLTRSVKNLNRGLAVGVDRFQRGAKVDSSRAQGIQ